ncbi:MAG: hypothetical protein Q3971_06805 [Moraxella sp.]|nr:hypothetical protein [Moraxella sp.]
MSQIIKRHQTIKVKIATRPSLTDVPKFVPQGLISTDDNNALTTGTDDKLYLNPLTKQDW